MMPRYTAVSSIVVASMLLLHATGRPIAVKPGDLPDVGKPETAAAASTEPLSQEQPDNSEAYSPDWVCGPVDQDVKGTDIEAIMDITKDECKNKCVEELSCTYITYASKWPQPTTGVIPTDCVIVNMGSQAYHECIDQANAGGDRTRCVLKKDWNDGPDGSTGKSLAVTWCCDKNATDCNL